MNRSLGVEQRYRALQLCPVLAAAAAEELWLLAEIARVELLAPGETLFEAGEVAHEVFVVASGALHVFVPHCTGPANTLHPGDLFGEYAMFYDNVRTTTVRAADEACLLSLDYRRFRACLLRFPEIALKLLEITVRRLVALERKTSTPNTMERS